MDPKHEGQIQKEWGWWIAVYLFLGGVGSGAYAIGAINSFLGVPFQLPTAIALWIACPALVVGSLALLADLGQPGKATKAGVKVGTSWIARGFWIISIFIVISFLHLVLLFFTDFRHQPSGGTILSALAIAGTVAAFGTMAYTGILLGASKGIPFWRTAAVPVVFVISALVTGHFTIMVGVVSHGGPIPFDMLQAMSLEALGLVVLEVLAIVFFLQAAYRTPDAKESAERIMNRQSFVVGYLLLGLIAPAVLMGMLYFALADVDMQTAYIMAGIGAILGLAGGLILRHAVLVTGALPSLNIAGFQFRRIARPKQPKPAVGLLPPS
ncbi:MAG: polysulfide reductase NrfD [Deltaproteobacteria bacterium]|jgi:formate-dependent nitrite reductase membrane component NrfD|nr:polysulfide reductase NrfD [Deltaproteobacteria bacterium]MBW2536537.1 polysulfide reductase NrfD [Deltaproteobacteria bacterium]